MSILKINKTADQYFKNPLSDDEIQFAKEHLNKQRGKAKRYIFFMIICIFIVAVPFAFNLYVVSFNDIPWEKEPLINQLPVMILFVVIYVLASAASHDQEIFAPSKGDLSVVIGGREFLRTPGFEGEMARCLEYTDINQNYKIFPELHHFLDLLESKGRKAITLELNLMNDYINRKLGTLD